MTEIRIYHGVSNPALFVARLLQKKLLPKKNRVMIHAGSKNDASRLDADLWRLPDESSFIPHCGIDEDIAERTPVVIGEQGSSEVRDAMISMVADIPDGAISHHHFIAILGERLDAVPEFESKLGEYERQGYKVMRFDRSAA